MELDFDKEIDAILRKAHRDGPVLIGDFANANHLDADEISAFAENAMPENSRALYSAHLAECNRCRKILSNLLVMNAEEAPARSSPAAAAPAASAVPWYRRLFLFPNLAYVMGGLVLIFGGFLALTIVQKSRVGESGMISQTAEPPSTQGGPYFDSEPGMEDSNIGASANTAANTTARVSNMTANANTAPPATTLEKGPKEARAGADENNLVADGTTTDVLVTGSQPTTGAPAPPPSVVASEQPRGARDADLPKAKAEDKASGYAVQESDKKDASALKQKSVGTLNSTQSGPMQNNQSQYNRQLENLERVSPAKRMSGRRDEESSSGSKVVGGKTFERKQGVWYDTGYQGRPTINVRRGSDEFKRLDAGLRSIANALSGTVVIVWGAKAYRIQ